MKVILDTNVLLSSLIFRGKTVRVHDFCLAYCEVYTSPFLLNELYQILEKKFRIDAATAAEIKSRLEADFLIVKPRGKMPTICRDPDDNNVLLLAKSTRADFIITGDKDLLDLKFFKPTEIISPADFSKRFVDEQ